MACLHLAPFANTPGPVSAVDDGAEAVLAIEDARPMAQAPSPTDEVEATDPIVQGLSEVTRSSPHRAMTRFRSLAAASPAVRRRRGLRNADASRTDNSARW